MSHGNLQSLTQVMLKNEKNNYVKWYPNNMKLIDV